MIISSLTDMSAYFTASRFDLLDGEDRRSQSRYRDKTLCPLYVRGSREEAASQFESVYEISMLPHIPNHIQPVPNLSDKNIPQTTFTQNREFYILIKLYRSFLVCTLYYFFRFFILLLLFFFLMLVWTAVYTAFPFVREHA